MRLMKNQKKYLFVIPYLMRNLLKINMLWIPAFAGMTVKRRFFNSHNHLINENVPAGEFVTTRYIIKQERKPDVYTKNYTENYFYRICF